MLTLYKMTQVQVSDRALSANSLGGPTGSTPRSGSDNHGFERDSGYLRDKYGKDMEDPLDDKPRSAFSDMSGKGNLAHLNYNSILIFNYVFTGSGGSQARDFEDALVDSSYAVSPLKGMVHFLNLGTLIGVFPAVRGEKLIYFGFACCVPQTIWAIFFTVISRILPRFRRQLNLSGSKKERS